MSKKKRFNIDAISIPTFKVTLLNGRVITVRSIILNEYRNLILAKDQSTSDADILVAIEQVVTNAVIDDIDIDELTIYDFEMIFVKSFEFSTGTNKIPVMFQCTNKVKGTLDDNEEDGDGSNTAIVECATPVEAMLHFKDMKPSTTVVDDLIEKDFIIQEGNDVEQRVTIKVTRPSFIEMNNINNKTAENVIMSIISRFKCISVNDVITPASELEQEDLNTIFERIRPTVVQDMYDFISNVPRVQQVIQFKCPSCNKRYSHTLTGIEDFFV